MTAVLKRPQFLLDLAEELTYLNEKAGANVAARWYDALMATIEELKHQPFLGRERDELTPKNVRTWRVKGFPRWLIFYQAREDGALIFLRVRYGTMNLPMLELES